MKTEFKLSFGTVRVERRDPADDRPWVTPYELSGPRIRGVVQIAPTFSELGEDSWEFLPSGLLVAYGRSTWNPGGVSGSLEVLGSRLASYTVIHPGEKDYRFTVRRNETGVGDYPAPNGTRDRTREVVQALVILHREDLAFVHEKAAEYLRSRRHDRLNAIERDYREIDQQIRALQTRRDSLQERRTLMGSDWSFETTIDEAAQAVAPVQ
ncbi:hypothetical protein [Streptomyces sp. NPDC059009]|uniref:hypothetical protein n=1 Tax=Streptomyces sp. NPDC059009 TaxID=3346694 RepID=UPI0036B46A63